jgi:hypothetical protein
MTSSTSTDGSTTSSRSDAAPQPAAAPPEPAPSAELLEFLGEFSDERGEWLDPLDLDEADAAAAEHGEGR